MKLQQLRQFSVLAETLNFHRAAERLHMAQPPLSTAIRKLEDELGVPLFTRDPGNLRLTDAGRILQGHANRVLRDVDEMKRAAAECAMGDQGRLVLGFSGTSGYVVLPHLVPRFKALYPRVELKLHESASLELTRDLAERTVDVAVVFTPLFEDTRASLLPIAQDQFVLAVQPDNPLARRDYVSLADIADEPLVLWSRDRVPAMHALVTMAFAQAGITPRVVQDFVQVTTALRLAESGIGVAVVPSAMARSIIANVRLVPLLDLPAVGIVLAHDPDTASGPALRFVEVAAQWVREQAASHIIPMPPLTSMQAPVM